MDSYVKIDEANVKICSDSSFPKEILLDNNINIINSYEMVNVNNLNNNPNFEVVDDEDDVNDSDWGYIYNSTNNINNCISINDNFDIRMNTDNQKLSDISYTNSNYFSNSFSRVVSNTFSKKKILL
jgi:hypothetical protein